MEGRGEWQAASVSSFTKAVDDAKPRMEDDEDRWRFHQAPPHLMGDAAQSRSVFFTVLERGFQRNGFAVGLRFWFPTTRVEGTLCLFRF